LSTTFYICEGNKWNRKKLIAPRRAPRAITILLANGSQSCYDGSVAEKRRTRSLKELEKIFNESAALLNKTWMEIEALKAKIEAKRKKESKKIPSPGKRKN
jgi:hypothetical protein